MHSVPSFFPETFCYISYLSRIPAFMNNGFKWFIILLTCLVSNTICFAYKVTGTFKNLACFYPKVYLAVINNIDGIYGASSQDIISSADVDTNGNFTITGNDLPDENRFYRLYLTEDKRINTSIQCGERRNYVLLAMNNKTEVSISCENFCKPFFTYSVSGSAENEAMLFVQNLLVESNAALWDSVGNSKKEFLVAKRYAGLKQFADTSGNLLAAMWAVTEMDIDSNYNKDKTFFNSFAGRFRKKANAPIYSRQLDERLDILQYKKERRHSQPSGIAFLIVCGLLGCSVVLNIYLTRKRKQAAPVGFTETLIEMPSSVANDEENIKGLIEKLTIKEREILKMVNHGLSNKEIAEKLFVEVSTVKSHISNIYQKTEIKNRKEVAGVARYL